MEFVTSVVGGKALRDRRALSITLGLQSGDALAQILHADHPTRQTAPGENTDFDLGHVEPTAMLGRVMELDPLQDAPGLGWLERFIEGRSGMRVQVILHDAHVFGMRIDRIDQPLNAVGVVALGAMVGHFDMAPASKRLDKEKQIGGAQPFILVIHALRTPGLHRFRSPHICLGRHEFFVETHRWIPRVVLLLVEIQHILHGSNELRTYLGDAPLLVLPGLEFVFFSNWRMVSGEMDSTKPSSTAFPASKRTVQWSCPLGAGLHVMAIRWAACPPVNAWRYRAWRLSCRTA
jgi:hypothetical protein